MDGINFNVVPILQIQSKPISKDLHFLRSGKRVFFIILGLVIGDLGK